MSTAQDPWPLELDVHAVKQLMDTGEPFLLLDVRQPDEHAIVHLEAARLIPMNDVPGRLGELEPHRAERVVVHCHHGGRSLQVTQWLREQGFARAQNMAGGIDAWAEQIDPRLPRY